MKSRKTLTDQDAEILAELYFRHINVNKKSIRFSSPEQLLSFLRRSRLKTPSLNFTLPAYLKGVRTDHKLTRQDIAKATNISIEELKKIEARTSLPWDLSPVVVAKIVCLYGIHIRKLKRLSKNSCNIAIFSRRISDRDAASAKTSEWLSQVRGALVQLGAKELIA